MALHRSPSSGRFLGGRGVALLIAVVVSFLSLGFLVPLYSLYARDAVGASSAQVGLMASAFLVAGLVSAPVVGLLADRFGHGRVLWMALLAHAVIIVGYIAATRPYHLLVLRALEGAAAMGVLPPARALMNGFAPRRRQAEALGLVSAAELVGILVGPALGAFLASFAGFTGSFLVSAGGLALVAVWVFVVLPPRAESLPDAQALAGGASHAFSARLTIAYTLRALLSVPQGVATAVWSLYMADRGAAVPLIGLSFTTFALPAILAAPVAGRISDRHGRFWPLVAGLAGSASVYCLYGFALSPLTIVALSLVEGTGAAVARSSLDGFLADSIPPGMRGRVQANFSAADIGGALIGATGAGLVYRAGPGVPFAVEGLLLLALTGLLFLPPLSRSLQGPSRRRSDRGATPSPSSGASDDQTPGSVID
jgi:MFS family permease